MWADTIEFVYECIHLFVRPSLCKRKMNGKLPDVLFEHGKAFAAIV